MAWYLVKHRDNLRFMIVESGLL